MLCDVNVHEHEHALENWIKCLELLAVLYCLQFDEEV